jgi:hypothetical protein
MLELFTGRIITGLHSANFFDSIHSVVRDNNVCFLITVKTQLPYESKVLQIWFKMGQRMSADTGPSSGQHGTYKIH